MQHSPNEIKEKLLRALDKDNNVVNMAAVTEVIAILEKMPITKDELEKTRLGKYVNELRKKTNNDALAKRAKDLVRRWRALILPQEGTVVNGERPLVVTVEGLSPGSNTTHLPGPGPGSALTSVHGAETVTWTGPGGGRPCSPAVSLGNGSNIRGKSLSPAVNFLLQQQQHRTLSPGNSSCSSASTSPSVFHARQSNHSTGGHSRPGTPNQLPAGIGPLLSVKSRGGGNSQLPPVHLQGFKPVSPALFAAGGGSGSRSSTPGTGPSKRSLLPQSPKLSAPAGGKSVVTNRISTVELSSAPVSPALSTSPEIASAAKRSRPLSDGLPTPVFDGHGKKPSQQLGNSSFTPPHVGIPNGVDAGDSMDSVPSSSECYGDGDHESLASGLPTEACRSGDASGIVSGGSCQQKRRNSRHGGPDRCDVLKDKLASHLRTHKVKTTAELLEELKARKAGTGTHLEASLPVLGNGSGAAQRVSAVLNAATSVTSPNLFRRTVNSAFPSSDEDVARTKTELMEKFLKDTTVSGVKSDRTEGLTEVARGTSLTNDPVAAILATLPPLSADDLDIKDDALLGEEDCNQVTQGSKEVTEDEVRRLLSQDWEEMNGNFNHMGVFRRWNEVLERTSFSSDVLRILPYVDID